MASTKAEISAAIPDSSVTVLNSADEHDGIPEAVFFVSLLACSLSALP